MENSIQELLELLYSMISEAWGVPLGNEKCVIERNKALDILDEIKTRFPMELAEAKRLIDAKTEYISNAKHEAESIRKAAEEHAKQLVEEQEIVRIAREKSNEMVTSAERTSSELKRVANEYVDDTMKRTEEALATALEEMRQSRARFRSAAGSSAKAPIAPELDINLDE